MRTRIPFYARKKSSSFIMPRVGEAQINQAACEKRVYCVFDWVLSPISARKGILFLHQKKVRLEKVDHEM